MSASSVVAGRRDHRVRSSARRSSTPSLPPILIVLGAALARRARRGLRAAARRGSHAAARRWPSLGFAGGAGRRRRCCTATPRRRVGRPARWRSTAPALFMQGTILVLGAAGACCWSPNARSTGRQRDRRVRRPWSPARRPTAGSRADRVQTEVFPLMLFAVAGMLIFPVANNLLVMFVALEVLSLPLYLMAGLARRRRLLSQEAALKYFLLGAFASAFFLYGLALLYGYAGTVDLAGIADAAQRRRPVRRAALPRARPAAGRPAVQGRRRAVPLLDAGRLPGLAHAGHRVHGGRAPRSPRSVRCCGCSTSASAGRAGTGGRSSGPSRSLTMVVGAVFGLTQTDVKRMLAYSSIAHAGFILVGLVGGDQATAVRLAVLPGRPTASPRSRAFGVVTLVRDADGEATHLSQWSGLGPDGHRCWPAIFAFLLLALAGIPLTSGFTGKFAVFRRRSAGNAPAAGGRSLWSLGDRRVLLRADHRADVLLRTAPATARRRGPRLTSHRRAHGRRCVTARARRRSRSRARPGRAHGGFSSYADGVRDDHGNRALGIDVRRPGARDRGPGAGCSTRRGARCATSVAVRRRVRRRRRPPPRSTPAANGSGRCSCCWRPHFGDPAGAGVSSRRRSSSS